MAKQPKGPVGFPCPNNCTGGSVKVMCSSCNAKPGGCAVCSNGWVWETCGRCHGRGVID